MKIRFISTSLLILAVITVAAAFLTEGSMATTDIQPISLKNEYGEILALRSAGGNRLQGDLYFEVFPGRLSPTSYPAEAVMLDDNHLVVNVAIDGVEQRMDMVRNAGETPDVWLASVEADAREIGMHVQFEQTFTSAESD